MTVGKFSPRSRREIVLRDGFACRYCGGPPPLSIDHVIPYSRGGRNTIDNGVAACVPCNQTKGDRTPEEARMPLLPTPDRNRLRVSS